MKPITKRYVEVTLLHKEETEIVPEMPGTPDLPEMPEVPEIPDVPEDWASKCAFYGVNV